MSRRVRMQKRGKAAHTHPDLEDAPGLSGRGRLIHSGSVKLALTSCLRLLLASDGRLLIMLSLPNLLLDTGLRAASLKTAQRTVQ